MLKVKTLGCLQLIWDGQPVSLGERVEQCIRAGEDRTAADRAFHSAIVRATHNEFMARLLPVIDEAVSTAVAAGAHPEVLAGDTLRDHALLLEFFRKGDPEGAEYAMAIHMRHAMGELALEPEETGGRRP